MISQIKIKYNKQNIFLKTVLIFFTSVMSFWFIVPSVKVMISDVTAGVLIFTGCLLFVFTNKRFLSAFIIIEFLILLFTIENFLFFNSFNFHTSLALFLNLNICIMPAVIFIVFSQTCTYIQKRNFSLFLTLLIGFVIIASIIGLSQYPGVARVTSSTYYREMNIVGFNMSYGIGIAFPAFLCILFTLKRNKLIFLKYVMLIYIALAAICLYLTEYGSLILILLLSIVILIFFRDKRINLYRSIIAVIAFLTLFLTIPYILQFLADNISSNTLSLRFNELSLFLQGQSITGTGSYRIDYIKDSLKLFIASPLWGNKFYNHVAHSTFVDLLAKNGIIGLTLYIFLLYICRKLTVKQIFKDKKCFKYYKNSFLIFILIAMVNPVLIAFEMNYIIWFYVPLIIDCCSYSLGGKTEIEINKIT